MQARYIGLCYMSRVQIFYFICASYLKQTNISSTDEMANNGLLFISNVGKAHMVCQKVSQFVRRVLYVNIKENIDLESVLPAISTQIDTLYSTVSSL